MTLYMILFFLGFILAICMLAYASMQVTELGKKTEQFGDRMLERYSKPFTGVDEAEKKEEGKEKEEKKEEKKEA